MRYVLVLVALVACGVEDDDGPRSWHDCSYTAYCEGTNGDPSTNLDTVECITEHEATSRSNRAWCPIGLEDPPCGSTAIVCIHWSCFERHELQGDPVGPCEPP